MEERTGNNREEGDTRVHGHDDEFSVGTLEIKEGKPERGDSIAEDIQVEKRRWPKRGRVPADGDKMGVSVGRTGCQSLGGGAARDIGLMMPSDPIYRPESEMKNRRKNR